MPVTQGQATEDCDWEEPTWSVRSIASPNHGIFLQGSSVGIMKSKGLVVYG